jgi:hypothetical protein
VAFLFAPPQPIEPNSDQQGDQLDFGRLQIGFGVAVIVRQDFPFISPMPGVHKNEFAGRPGGIKRSIRLHRMTQRGNQTFVCR